MRIGPYEVLETIGRGGMGVVYRARTPSGEVVALKVLARTQQESVARFEREQRLLRSFTVQDGFVPLLDAGSTPGGPYLVMPLVPGGTLRERLRGPIGVEATLALGRTLAAALGRAHARGIVHRDLKPENVLFDASGQPLVADLGLAKHFDRLASGASQSVSLSREGTSRGTAGYMPPEQLDDAKSVGPPADVFSLGAILYECLAGRPVFTGDTTLEVVQNVAAGKFDRLDRSEAPPWLAVVVERALAVKAGDRFKDGSAFEKALEEPARRRSRLVPVVVAALAAVSLVGVFVMGRHAEAPPVVAPPANLPPGLREGSKKGELQVYLWKLPGDAGDMELVKVPAGDFLMGSDTDEDALEDEKPKHRHRLDRAYWIGRNPVTWAQYLAFCKATGREEPEEPSWWDKVPGSKGDRPVVMVSWVDAKAYCAWAGLALPSETEWERAARGADGRKYPWGNDWDPGARCNFADASCPLETIDMGWQRANEVFKAEGWEWDRKHQDGYPYTSPVGSYPKGESPVGALDMAGNVYQFCEDWYEPRAYDRYIKGDYAPPASGAERIGRGGAWVFPASHCRSASRGKITPNLHAAYLGFRVVLRAGS